MKQISFCITCMNRLKHLQETLEKNILDNFLVDEVEFVVLDYNSQDGLEEWIAHRLCPRSNMQNELHISTRGLQMPESPIRKLAPLDYKAEDEGVKLVVNFWTQKKAS